MSASARPLRSEEHTSELQSRSDLVCRLLLEKKKRARARRGASCKTQQVTGTDRRFGRRLRASCPGSHRPPPVANLFVAALRAFFFFNDTATTEIYTLSLHDALPIYPDRPVPAILRGLADLTALGWTIA